MPIRYFWSNWISCASVLSTFGGLSVGASALSQPLCVHGPMLR